MEERGEPALRASRKLRGLAFAAFGGEKCSNYFQYSAPARKSQQFRGRLASLGDQIERNFPVKI
jgi:hypothetical protein